MDTSWLHRLGIFFLCGLFSVHLLQAGEVFTTNASNPSVTLSAAEVLNILIGKQGTWPNGQRLILIIPKNSAAAEAALKQYTGYSIDQFLNYWKRLVFTGKGKMPTLVADEAAALKSVAEIPAALTIASEAAATRRGLKVIIIK
jgi:hypothetical protein